MIRAAETNDLTTLAEIYYAAWRMAFSKYFSSANLTQVSIADFEDRWRGFFAGEHVHSFVCERDGVPVGFIACDVRTDVPAEILSLMVTPLSMRLGVGGELMEKALSDLRERECEWAILWVVNENANARRFYERFGFYCTEGKRSIQRYGIELCQLRYEKKL